jgi:gliding motility-associated-like protein
LVFETNDYNNQWAGTRNNEQLPDGVYFYSIKCSNSDEYTGEINLLRFKK